MIKQGLSNTLLDKIVVPAITLKYGGEPHADVLDWTNKDADHPGWPRNFHADVNGKCHARIVAAWAIPDGHIMVALVDPHGNCGEAFFEHVRISK